MSKGLYDKYQITKTDGTSIDPDAQYFVLRMDKDIDAIDAAMQWASTKQKWLLYYELQDLRGDVSVTMEVTDD